MAGLDANAVALNLKNTLSPEANVRKQGKPVVLHTVGLISCHRKISCNFGRLTFVLSDL